MEHQHNHPIIGIFLLIGTFFGITSMADLDILLAVILKGASILSFVVATCYALWKWRNEYKKAKDGK